MRRFRRGLRGPTAREGRREAVALGLFGVLLVSAALVTGASAATAAQEASRHPAAAPAKREPARSGQTSRRGSLEAGGTCRPGGSVG